MSQSVLIGEINPKKKRKKAKKAAKPKRRRTKAAAPKRRRRRAAPKRPTRRRAVKGARLNPVEGDIIKTAKDAGLISLGVMLAYVAADYFAKKVDYVAENANVAKPAIMAIAGLTVPEVIKGRNKALATKLGYGALVAAILYAAMPWLSEKIPGLTDTGLPTAEPVEGYYRAGQVGTYLQTRGASGGALGAYYGESGAMTPEGMGALTLMPGTQ